MASTITFPLIKKLMKSGAKDMFSIADSFPANYIDNVNKSVYRNTTVAEADRVKALTNNGIVGIDLIAYLSTMQPGEEVIIDEFKNGRYIAFNYIDSTHYSLQGYNADYSPYAGGITSNNVATMLSDLTFYIEGHTLALVDGNGPYLCDFRIVKRNNNTAETYIDVTKSSSDTMHWKAFFDAEENASPDPYSTIPDNDNLGSGYGPYDYTSEEDLPPALPGASAAQCGFVSLWNPTITELTDLSSYLWNDSWWVNTWHHLFSNPMDVILSIGIIPFHPDTEDTKTEIVFGTGGNSGVNAYKVTEQYYVIPMGTMHITGMSQGYTDYEPYAKASIFLPYCGTYALSCDEIVDADISLEYHVDIYTGACVAYLTIERTNSNGENVHAVMYQFTGNMLATIPVTGADHSNFIQSLLFMGAAIGATVATAGGAAPEIAGASAAGDAVAMGSANMLTAGSAINTVMSMKPNVMRSGNLSSNAGMLGKQAPTITITWSNICRPSTEYELTGMPIHKSGTLSDFQGFTIVSAVHMDNITCTDEERTLIEEQLYKGVII